MRRSLAVLLRALACLAVPVSGALGEEPTMALSLRSPAFQPGGEIPARHTCEGADVSPPLTWSGVPAKAKSLALIVDDPDAPDPAAPNPLAWVHWVLYNMSPSPSGLPEGAGRGALPPGALPGTNDWRHPWYNGPCPPIGRHRYFVKLYALDTVLHGLHDPSKAELEEAMKGHILAHAELVGTYRKH
jgi:Raf kinase inhibitor-like YbhB/YbcL family protein